MILEGKLHKILARKQKLENKTKNQLARKQKKKTS